VILLRAKQVDYDVTYINLQEKPDWFLKISPHGKVPVLNVGDQPLFESNAIAEFLEESAAPALHPADPIKRARNRAWTDYVPTFASAISGIYYASSEEELAEGLENARAPLAKLEEAINAERTASDGPWFNGPELSLVDAAYAPFFFRFAFIEDQLKSGLLNDYPKVAAWADALVSSDLVKGAVADNFPEMFVANLKRRSCAVARLF